MNRENYSNFDLEFYRVGEKYVVKVRSFTGEAKHTFSPPFTIEEAEQYILSIQNSIYTASQDIRAIKKFGGTLFETVFQKDIRASYKSSLDVITSQEGAGLRVRLHLQDVPEFAHLPWEYLYQANTNQFLCLNRQTPIVRYLDIPKIITPLNIKLPLRILVFISSPSNLDPLNVDNEIYHNNFLNNDGNAHDSSDIGNSWDDGAYGNFWSDYKQKYPNAKKILQDGVWDTPYQIPGRDNKDNRPLIKQWPKSSTTTNPRSLNLISGWIKRCVPMTTSTSPFFSFSTISFCCFGVLNLLNISTLILNLLILFVKDLKC